jgi:hypothetical protein
MLNSEKPAEPGRLPNAPGAKASLVLGIVSDAWPVVGAVLAVGTYRLVRAIPANSETLLLLVGCIVLAGAVPGVLGVILAIRALVRIDKSQGRLGGRGVSLAGLITSTLGTLAVLVLANLVGFLNSEMESLGH